MIRMIAAVYFYVLGSAISDFGNQIGELFILLLNSLLKKIILS